MNNKLIFISLMLISITHAKNIPDGKYKIIKSPNYKILNSNNNSYLKIKNNKIYSKNDTLLIQNNYKLIDRISINCYLIDKKENKLNLNYSSKTMICKY